MDLHPCRFSRPAPDRGNDISCNDLQSTLTERCTECCTPSLKDEISPDLMALIEAWPELPENIQQAILALGRLSPKGGK
jgi:hypothetical protein